MLLFTLKATHFDLSYLPRHITLPSPRFTSGEGKATRRLRCIERILGTRLGSDNRVFDDVIKLLIQNFYKDIKEPLKVLFSSGTRGTKIISVYCFPSQ